MKLEGARRGAGAVPAVQSANSDSCWLEKGCAPRLKKRFDEPYRLVSISTHNLYFRHRWSSLFAEASNVSPSFHNGPHRNHRLRVKAPNLSLRIFADLGLHTSSAYSSPRDQCFMCAWNNAPYFLKLIEAHPANSASKNFVCRAWTFRNRRRIVTSA